MSRPVRLTECNRCHLPILTGTDDYAGEIRADLIPLTRHGEIQATIAGQTCWRIDADRKAWRTDQWRILTDKPLPGDHRITTHACGQPTPTSWAAPPAPPPTASNPDEEPTW